MAAIIDGPKPPLSFNEFCDKRNGVGAKFDGEVFQNTLAEYVHARYGAMRGEVTPPTARQGKKLTRTAIRRARQLVWLGKTVG